MHTKIKKWVLLFVLLVAPILWYTGCLKNATNNFATLAVIGQEGHTIHEFSFINQNNDTITNADYDGNIYIANFNFTSCKGQCQAMTNRMGYLQNQLKKQPLLQFVVLRHFFYLFHLLLFSQDLAYLSNLLRG